MGADAVYKMLHVIHLSTRAEGRVDGLVAIFRVLDSYEASAECATGALAPFPWRGIIPNTVSVYRTLNTNHPLTESHSL